MRGNILIERRKYFRIKLDLAISQLHIYINFKPKRNISSFYSRVFKNKKENIEIELHSKHLFDDPLIYFDWTLFPWFLCMYVLFEYYWLKMEKKIKQTHNFSIFRVHHWQQLSQFFFHLWNLFVSRFYVPPQALAQWHSSFQHFILYSCLKTANIKLSKILNMFTHSSNFVCSSHSALLTSSSPLLKHKSPWGHGSIVMNSWDTSNFYDSFPIVVF